MGKFLSDGEYAYYKVVECAAMYFTARLLTAYHDYLYVALGLCAFIAYEALKAALAWRGKRQAYAKVLCALEQTPLNAVQQDEKEEDREF